MIRNWPMSPSFCSMKSMNAVSMPIWRLPWRSTFAPPFAPI
jgi:hypothetical protein